MDASLTHCNRKGLGMSKSEIIIVVFLPLGWTISCLYIKESHYPPGALWVFLELVQWLRIWKCPQSYAHSKENFLIKEEIYNSSNLGKVHWVYEWEVTGLTRIRHSTQGWDLLCSQKTEKIQMLNVFNVALLSQALGCDSGGLTQD